MATEFAYDSNQINSGFTSTLEKIANVLVSYGKTHLMIVGRTDNVGSNRYNQTLSERRAQSVKDLLRTKRVIPQRLVSGGEGETSPRATNATQE